MVFIRIRRAQSHFFGFVCALSLAVIMISAHPAASERRVALVIGNSNYQNASVLPNAVQDAKDVSAALGALGFEVHSGYDLDRIGMLRLAAKVTSDLKPEDVALFYFSGHGLQLGAENYILPTDTSGASAEDLKTASVSLQAVLREMELRSERNVVILDACRNNPFEANDAARSIGGATRGLARVDAGVGSYIAFSTQPGNVALDGTGKNSPFTSALLRQLAEPKGDIHEVMRLVRAEVVTATNGAQIPWENSSMIEQLFLAEPDKVETATAPVVSAPIAPETPRASDASAYRHVVQGLDPNGDNFLALRDGTSSSATRIAKMTEGTRLSVLDQNGPWFHVRTETGLQGWAHSNWIRFVGTRATSAETSCDALWFQRNSYFHKYGYCFGSARGQAAFSNANCNPALSAGSVPLKPHERNEVARLKALETSLGCK